MMTVAVCYWSSFLQSVSWAIELRYCTIVAVPDTTCYHRFQHSQIRAEKSAHWRLYNSSRAGRAFKNFTVVERLSCVGAARVKSHMLGFLVLLNASIGSGALLHLYNSFSCNNETVWKTKYFVSSCQEKGLLGMFMVHRARQAHMQCSHGGQ